MSVEVGQRFGRLTVADPGVRKEVPSVPRGLRAALCECDCGTRLTVTISQLVRGGTQSCGCRQRDKAAGRFRSHGLHAHPLYNVHHGMMQRCYDPAHPAYHRYGGRGIAVCAPWHDLRTFINEVMREIGPRPEGKTLDRYPDNNGNYEPGNVRWATRSEQGKNASHPPRQRSAPKQARAAAVIRDNPGLTNAALAELAGCDARTISRARNGG